MAVPMADEAVKDGFHPWYLTPRPNDLRLGEVARGHRCDAWDDCGGDRAVVCTELGCLREGERVGIGRIHAGALVNLRETPSFIEAAPEPDGLLPLEDEMDDVVHGSRDVPYVEAD
jgi:hypothetical protein